MRPTKRAAPSLRCTHDSVVILQPVVGMGGPRVGWTPGEGGCEQHLRLLEGLMGPAPLSTAPEIPGIEWVWGAGASCICPESSSLPGESQASGLLDP